MSISVFNINVNFFLCISVHIITTSIGYDIKFKENKNRNKCKGIALKNDTFSFICNVDYNKDDHFHSNANM